MSSFFNSLIPIGICVVLPIVIIWIIYRAKTNKDNKSAEVLIKAIESNSVSDVDRLMEILSIDEKKKGGKRTDLSEKRLLRGTGYTLASIAVGICTSIFYSMTENSLNENDFFLLLLLVCIGFSIGIANLTVFFIYRRRGLNKDEE